MDTAPNTPLFNGTFTPEFQRLFKEKRLQLGLTGTELARYLGVSNSLISCWEHGKSTHCTIENTKLVGEFLKGKYDTILLEKKRSENQTVSSPTYPPEARNLAEKLVALYQVLSDTPEQRQRFLKKLDDIIEKYS